MANFHKNSQKLLLKTVLIFSFLIIGINHSQAGIFSWLKTWGSNKVAEAPMLNTGTNEATAKLMMTGGALAFAIQPSCTDGVPNNDGYLQLSEITLGDRVNYSTGASYSGDIDYANATVIGTMPFQFATGLSNPSVSQNYTLRIFDGSSSTYSDTTIIMNEQDCTVGCDCEEKIYLNDVYTHEVHKFSITNTGNLLEIGSPWLANGNINSPHGLGVDGNGNLYIGEVTGYNQGIKGKIFQLDSDGNVLDNDFINLDNDNFGFQLMSKNGILYTTNNETNEVQAFDLCTGNLIGGMPVGVSADILAWGMYLDEGENSWYVADRWSGNVYKGSLDTSLFNNPANTGSVVFDTGIIGGGSGDVAATGITRDDAGNFFLVYNAITGGAATVSISKYNPAGTLITTISDNTNAYNTANGVTGFWGARGIAYSSEEDKLYVSSRDNCLTVFETDLTEVVALNIGNPVNSSAKGIVITKECGPSNNNVTLDTTLCATSSQIFLQELINCEGTISEGIWIEGSGNTGLTYNACDNSIIINSQGACGSFTLSSDGTGNNPQYGAFKMTVNIKVKSCVKTFAIQASCTDGVPNNDGYLQLSEVLQGDRVNYSAGASYTGDTDYANATVIGSMPFQFATGLSNPSVSQSYTMRIFDGSSSVYLDTTITINEQDCSIGFDCKEMIYLNDAQAHEVHKFELNNGSLSEIGSPWLASGIINSPHGLAVDLNGRLYIGQADGFTASPNGPIFQLSSTGEVLDSNFINLVAANNTYGFQMFSKDGIIYTNPNEVLGTQGEIQAYSSCDGELLGQFSTTPNGAYMLAWGMYLDEAENNFYVPDRVSGNVYVGTLDTGSYTNPSSVGGTALFNTGFTEGASAASAAMGITRDMNGNFYIVFNRVDGTEATVYIRKYDSLGNLITTISDSNVNVNTTNGQSGFWGARGIVYSETENKLYVSSFANCISVFDTDLVEQTSLNIGNPTGFIDSSGFTQGGQAKGIVITQECCPTNNNIVIDTMLCASSINDVIFLKELLNSEGTISEGTWTEGSSNTGFTFNVCDNSVTIDGSEGSGTFTLSSDGTAANAQCGAFKITININIASVDLTVAQTACTDNGNGTFTATYDAVVNWANVSCALGETINVTHNGTSIGVIDPSTDSSPMTFATSIAADGTGMESFKAAFVTTSYPSDSITFNSPLPCPADIAPCASNTGCLGGNVFEDNNFNGTEDTSEPGIQGVEVAYQAMTPVIAASANGVSSTETSSIGNNTNFVQFNGVTNFSGGTAFVLISGTALPVELSRFQARAEDCAVRLLWLSESEENFDYYELQWSGDGQDFRAIETIEGKGGTTTAVYEFVDRSAKDFNYYRLKMVDLDGSYKYSKVVNIAINCAGDEDLLIYPNPSSKDNGILNIKFYSGRDEAQINIVDMLGRTVQSISLDVEKEWNTIRIDISDLPAGTYNVQVAGEKNSKMLIIQN